MRSPIKLPIKMQPNIDNAYGYIYLVTNLLNGKQYVGQHRRSTFDSKYYGSGKIIQLAIKKHGINNFSLVVLDWAKNKEELCEKEIYWIDLLLTMSYGYNLTKGGDGGITWLSPEDNPAKSPSARAKISLQKLSLGDNHPMKNPEISRKVSEKKKGTFTGKDNVMYNPEVRKRHKEIVNSEEYKRKISIAGKRLGENHPSKRKEFRELMSTYLSQRLSSPEAKEKLRENLGDQSGGNNNMAKKVRIIETNEIFCCIKDLRAYLGVGEWVITDRLNHNVGKPFKTKIGTITIEIVEG